MSKTMFFSAALVAALAMGTQGCGLFEKKEEEKPAQGGGASGGGDQGGQPQGGGMDPLQFVNAPGTVMICPDAKVGYMAQQTVDAGGQTVVTSYAVVGESGDSFLVESVSPAISAMAGSFPDLKGMILGLTVKKADGTVTKAVAGKPGEAGKDVKIGPATPPAKAGEAPKGTPESCTIGIGTFDALKFENSGVTSWVGTSGATKDVLLKVQGQDGYELAELPKDEELDIGGTKVKTRYTAYTNGMKQWMTENTVIACLFGGAAADGKRAGLARMETAQSKINITAVKTDATPQLKW